MLTVHRSNSYPMGSYDAPAKDDDAVAMYALGEVLVMAGMAFKMKSVRGGDSPILPSGFRVEVKKEGYDLQVFLYGEWDKEDDVPG